jgi:hypothetical protein
MRAVANQPNESASNGAYVTMGISSARPKGLSPAGVASVGERPVDACAPILVTHLGHLAGAADDG